MTQRLLTVALVCLGWGWTASGHAQRPPDNATQKSSPQVIAAFRGVVAKPSQSTVRVLADGKEAALGTVVGADGWILTKASELKGKVVCKLRDGREHEARTVGIHEVFDLALLKVEAKGLTPVEWQESKHAPVGNWVASAGPGEDPVAIGVVSVATRSVAVSKVPPPASGTAGSGYLGIGLEVSDGGPKINQVTPDSAAAKAGLKVNDIVLSVQGKEIVDTESLINTIQSYKPGDVVTIRVMRRDQEVELKATLAKRPANMGRSDFQNALGSTLSTRRTGFPTFLQHDTVLRAIDCGGPLVDLDGQVIGVNIARAGRTESYAIPSEAVKALLPDLQSGKLAPKKEPTPEERVAAASAALKQAEADRAAADAKIAAAQAALKQAEADRVAADAKVATAKAALEKAEADAKAAKKPESK